MGRLLLLFILVPAVELVLLIEIGSRIGTLATLALIVGTGALGAILARRQGLRIIRQIQGELEAGRLPTDSLMDGVLILVAAALLVTPGILTDAVGFACLMPASRRLIKIFLRSRFERVVREQRVKVALHVQDFDGGPGRHPRGPIIDVTPDEAHPGSRAPWDIR